jgi:hypothetical protein
MSHPENVTFQGCDGCEAFTALMAMAFFPRTRIQFTTVIMCLLLMFVLLMSSKFLRILEGLVTAFDIARTNSLIFVLCSPQHSLVDARMSSAHFLSKDVDDLTPVEVFPSSLI